MLRFVVFFMPTIANKLHRDVTSDENFVKNEEPIKFAHRLFLKQVAIRSGLEPLIFFSHCHRLPLRFVNRLLAGLASVIDLDSTYYGKLP